MKGPFPILITLLLLTILPGPSSLYSSIPGDSLKYQDTIKSTSPKQPVYYTTRLSTARPVIDGKLDDECWKTGTWAGNFTQYMPDEGAKPSYPTELNILFDDKYVYVAIRAYDGTSKNAKAGWFT